MKKRFMTVLVTLALLLALVPASPANAGGSKVPGEPKCYDAPFFFFWQDNCHGRDMYRKVHKKTANPGVSTIKHAMLDVYGPATKKALGSAQAKSTLGSAHARVHGRNLSCHREMLLEYIELQTKGNRISKGATGLIGTAQRVVKRLPPGWKQAARMYLNGSKAAAKVADGYRVTSTAQKHLSASLGVCGQIT